MAKFRKRPVVVDAVRYYGDGASWRAVCLLCDESENIVFINGDRTLDVRTLEGTMTAQVGDWIIRGIKGELYPCKPDIFDATYERVEVAS